MPAEPEASTSAVLTLPNGLSLLRILAIPVFAWLIVHRGTEAAGLVVFGVVASTDWVDGYIARRTGRVSDLGKLLDPVADRLAIAAALIALIVRGVFPVWAALLILVRDGVVLVAGLALLATGGPRIDVRRVGKVATLELMVAVPFVAWGNLDLALAPAATALGWVAFAVGIVLYYLAALLYAGDARRELARGGGRS